MSDPTTIPPFPSDLPTATIHTIDFDLLSRDDPEQTALVHSAATGYGFFYLTNHHVDHEFMFTLAQKVFDLPLPEKMKYDMGSTGHYYGYKRSGGFVVDDKGTPDHSEFYNISKDEVLDIAGARKNKATPHPAVVTDCFPDLAQFIRSNHAIVTVVVRALGRSLGLPIDLLPSLHRIDQPSVCQARVTHAPPIPSTTVALGEHSDFGSVTVLFNRLGGLQVLNPYHHSSSSSSSSSAEPEWKYVTPRPECAVVNLGDALVKLCGNRLYSAVHRVLGPPGAQAERQRHSVVYFARPNSAVLLRSLFDDPDAQGTTDEGKALMNADDWVRQRARTWASANFKGRESYKASRGTEHNVRKGEALDRPAREIVAQ